MKPFCRVPKELEGRGTRPRIQSAGGRIECAARATPLRRHARLAAIATVLSFGLAIPELAAAERERPDELVEDVAVPDAVAGEREGTPEATQPVQRTPLRCGPGATRSASGTRCMPATEAPPPAAPFVVALRRMEVSPGAEGGDFQHFLVRLGGRVERCLVQHERDASDPPTTFLVSIRGEIVPAGSRASTSEVTVSLPDAYDNAAEECIRRVFEHARLPFTVSADAGVPFLVDYGVVRSARREESPEPFDDVFMWECGSGPEN